MEKGGSYSEKASLLHRDGSADSTGSYGSETGQSDSSQPATTSDMPHQSKSSKRDRLQQNPFLDKVDEDLEFRSDDAFSDKKSKCPDYFGVKSYLDHFYDRGNYWRDPTVYEDDDYEYLLHPGPRRRRRCTSIWWKVFVWIGANFLVFGIIGVLVGYLVPQRPIIVGNIERIEIIDRDAISFNFNLDVCKLVGLILFCIGGLTLTVALLFPSLLYHYCEEVERRDESFAVMAPPLQQKSPAKSQLDMTIPVTSSVHSVQPDRPAEESVVLREGLINIE